MAQYALLWLNVPVKSDGHVGLVTSNFVGHLTILKSDVCTPSFCLFVHGCCCFFALL